MICKIEHAPVGLVSFLCCVSLHGIKIEHAPMCFVMLQDAIIVL